LGIDRSGPRTQRLSGNAAAWIFGCYLHFIPISFNPQEHRSTRSGFYWYTADVSERTMMVWVGHSCPTRPCRFSGSVGQECPTHTSQARSLFRCTTFHPRRETRYTGILMANPIQPNVKLTNTPDYRETYANSVQIRVNVWDFFLVFGTLTQQSETQVEIQNFQGIYLSPQQAKALLGVLQQNVTGYENAFGEIKLDPRMMGHGPVH